MPRVRFDLEARRPYLVQAFTDAEYDRRVAALCAGMAREGLDALVVYANAASPSAVAYLTNYAPAFGNAFVVVRRDGQLAVATDAVLHAEPMHSMIWTCRVADVRVALGPVYGGAVDEVAALAADAAGAGSRVGLAGTAQLPQPLYATLASRLPGLRPADALLAAVRLWKSDEEIATMRTAGRAADAAMEAALGALAAGVEETAVAAAAVHRLLALGAREAFATCVVGGAQAGLKHGVPRRRALKPEEMVFVDLGASCDGYMSDLSRCTMVGPAGGPGRDLLKVGLDLYRAGLEAMRPGRTIDDVSKALLEVVRGTAYAPYYCPGGFGHGIGMSVIEVPGLFMGNTTELRPRMTVAYEPMVVIEGLGTGVVEDTLLITETGYERLTQYPVVTWS
ncbi:MAG: aminopeptidase P family protein [Bacillati bacterium ANGP1]|uniref:Aminopeptidase P family protein n=1 Tax=Candidatus Segetimicrobium genomatis TaxID=2569760 RepID=A0A537LS71_9BACT|nr:MAG: aminopeptidase P family protein [Terrabacteria group bacterium ANGP1]